MIIGLYVKKMRKNICFILTIFFISICLALIEGFVVKAETKENERTLDNNFDKGMNNFEIGNTSLSIFQRGKQVNSYGVDYYAYKDGLVDRHTRDHLTSYQVYNLNYFPGTLYYSVNEDSGVSRIEKIDLDTGVVEILYTHPEEIWEMYCVNNEYTLNIIFTTESEVKCVLIKRTKYIYGD